jgi:hypothetical protein
MEFGVTVRFNVVAVAWKVTVAVRVSVPDPFEADEYDAV